MKTCSKCGIQQPLKNFHKDSKRPDGVRASCKACYSLFHKNYYKNNTEKVKAKNKKMWLERKYNMSIEQYEKMKKEQNGKCAICFSTLKEGFLTHVDHDHNNGKIRGLLCRWCNTALGNFKDSILNLKNAVEYLKKFA
jgi:hypothetical protein